MRTYRMMPGWLLAVFAVDPTGTAQAADVQQPNIIFVMVDDLGPEWISAYGADDIKTPRIDQLAATGLTFHNAYSMPQCTPTRATLLTGQYPFRHGWVNHWDVPRWGAGCHFDPKLNVTFARQLKSVGYVTGIAGKWQINDFRVQPGILKEHGFDEWCMWTGYEGNNPPSGERYQDPFIYTTHEVGQHGWPRSNVRMNEFGRTGTYDDKFGPDLYNDFVCDFLRRHHDGPMLIYYPMALTHGPLVPTPAEPNAEGKVARHQAMVRYTDTLVGRMVDTLDELDIRKRTIIIFSTDNGTSGGITSHIDSEPIRGGKARLTENGPRQPFIVNCPGTVPVGETDCLTDFSDLLPTFCELAAAPLPDGVTLDGRSIAPVILGEESDGPRHWIMAMGFGAARLEDEGVRGVNDYNPRVVRDKRFKVHVDSTRTIHALYDLKADPREQHNLIESPDPLHRTALDKLTAVVSTFPQNDARPQYRPLPPQPWDRKVAATRKSNRAERQRGQADPAKSPPR